MTRQHFEAIAKVIRSSSMFANDEARFRFAVEMANELLQFNSKFNMAKFYEACTTE